MLAVPAWPITSLFQAGTRRTALEPTEETPEQRTIHRKMLQHVHAFPCQIAIQSTVPASVPIIRSDGSRTDEPLARVPYSVFSK